MRTTILAIALLLAACSAGAQTAQIYNTTHVREGGDDTAPIEAFASNYGSFNYDPVIGERVDGTTPIGTVASNYEPFPTSIGEGGGYTDGSNAIARSGFLLGVDIGGPYDPYSTSIGEGGGYTDGRNAIACSSFSTCSPYGPFPTHERWVVSEIAADNGLTVAVEVGSVVEGSLIPGGGMRSTSIAMLDGIVFTDFRHRQDVRIRIEHNCDTGRSTILDYPVIDYRGGQAVLSPEKAAIWRKGAMAWQFPERLSPVAEATVQAALCKSPLSDRRVYSSPAEAERWVLRTDHANNPEVALERAHRIVLENSSVISEALQRMVAGECKAQKSGLFGALEKRDNYLLKLAGAGEGRIGAGLHAGRAIVQGNDDAMDFELAAVRRARECLGDTSPLPAQGVQIPKALMPVQDEE